MAEILADSLRAQPCRCRPYGAVWHARERGTDRVRHCEAFRAQEDGQTGDPPDRLSEHHTSPRRKLSHRLLFFLFEHHLMHLHHRCSHPGGLDNCSVPASLSGIEVRWCPVIQVKSLFTMCFVQYSFTVINREITESMQTSSNIEQILLQNVFTKTIVSSFILNQFNVGSVL